jgi:hypothetical protein
MSAKKSRVAAKSSRPRSMAWKRLAGSFADRFLFNWGSLVAGFIKSDRFTSFKLTVSIVQLAAEFVGSGLFFKET